MVGMCIPGKYATFGSFDVKFKSKPAWDTAYELHAMVDFKSASTSTLVERVSIMRSGRHGEMIAQGNVNVKVNKPPPVMPSMKSLKKHSVDLMLQSKTVLITGASRGLGETMAKCCAAFGMRVAVNYYHGASDAQRVVHDIRSENGSAEAFHADVSDRQQVKEMVMFICKHFGGIDILINNAVRDALPRSFLELTWDDIQKEIEVTVKGAFNCCQEVIPIMKQRQAGKIINMSTIFTENPPPNQSKYIMTKSALIGLTRSLAVELAPYNIQVNAVVPSLVETDLSQGV
jgi:3-oxoacyl-[acyl-carrier protein] reductase